MSSFKILTGKPKAKRPVGTNLKEIGVNKRNLINSMHMDYWSVLVNAALILRVP